MTPLIHVGLAQHSYKNGLGAQSLTVATPLRILRAKLQLDYGGQPCHCLFIAFLYIICHYICMSCIICLNEIYFICVLARKPGSINRGLWSS